MMHYRPRTMAISAVVVVATLGFFPHSTTAQGLFSSLFQSRCTERCGFLGLSVVMRDGTPGSEDCWESCVFTSLLRPSSMVCGSCSTSSFDIGLDFIGIPPSDQTFFLDAKARWETIITGDVADRRSTRMRSGIPGCRFPLSIDDIRVCALYSSIDGRGRVLGSAGPAYIRNRGKDAGIPSAGFMQFDADDVAALIARGGFGSVILHEMAHVLGIGTVWDLQGVTGTDSEKCPYRGSKANDEYAAISGCPQVPTETDGGPGTRCGHWDERCLGDELLTGVLNTTGRSILSRITIATLDDLGYSVNYSTAEPFGIEDLGPGCACIQPPTRAPTSAAPVSAPAVFNETLGNRTNVTVTALPRLGGHGTHHGRRLSDESRQVAIEYGQTLLLERSQASLIDKPDDNEDLDGMIYVGDQILTVFIEEDGAIFDVTVRS